jgi:hypothetical protein
MIHIGMHHVMMKNTWQDSPDLARAQNFPYHISDHTDGAKQWEIRT